ncbi:Sister chromatid cohesion protein PDS5-like A [Hondaea fermentalgiana]|uniref:Sister chromatid cohesion protein PDS5-like A n=1 Tax=Hondaea fermentalgiana TaxID=2315210 RepID=A0A2R5GW97_9STRA|nr:Sister chromatid cohesion protein PDS5-like A [Hondaea fermentalgiana]|eukprot:GBG32214.1 Sister chromatid cohesion protein PDS5-like A [Hondaea fermentalgiana]
MPRLTRARRAAQDSDAREQQEENRGGRGRREEDREDAGSDDDGEVESAAKVSKPKRAKSLEPLRQGKNLRARLQTWQEQLSTREQLDDDEDTSELDHISAELLRPLVRRCKENSVLLLAGCCLADILHIYAPEPPYSSAEIKMVFDFLVDRLRGLQQKPGTESYKLSFYILQKLALCRSSCILVELPDEPDDPFTSEDLIVSLVEAMFDIMVPAREHEVEAHALELLVGLFDEMDRFSPRILDAVLVRLLPEQQKEAPKAFELAVKVIRQLADRLREPLAALLNGIVSGIHQTSARSGERARKRARKANGQTSAQGESSGGDDDENDDDEDEDQENEEDDDMEDSGALMGGRNAEETVATEIKDNVFEIIFQLFRIDASLLLYTLPHVATQLEASDEDLRRQTVDVVGRIFCEVDRPSLLADNARLWAAFLRRLLDVDSGIRLSLVSFAGFALNRDAPLLTTTLSDKASSDDEEMDENSTDDDDPEIKSMRRKRPVAETASGGANFWVKHFIAPNFHAQYAKTLDAGSQRATEREPSFLELALNDKDVNVRREAVEVVVAFVSRPGVLRQFKRYETGDALLRALAVRLCDKRIDLATSALEGLAKSFNAGLVEPYWTPEAEDQADNASSASDNDVGDAPELNEEEHAPKQSEAQAFAESTLEWIPNEIFSHALHHQRSHDETLLYRHALCAMMDNVILGRRRHRNLQVRAAILVRVWGDLDEVARNAFELILLRQRSRLTSLIMQVIQDRRESSFSSRASAGTRRSLVRSDQGEGRTFSRSRQGAESEAKARQALRQLAQEFVPSVRCPNASALLEAIWDNKDKHVFRNLRIIAACSGDDPEAVANAETDLLQRLGSKSETARAVRVLLTRLMPTAFVQAEIMELLGARAKRIARAGDDRAIEDLCSLVETAATHFKSLVDPETVDAAAWIFALAQERFCPTEQAGAREEQETQTLDATNGRRARQRGTRKSDSSSVKRRSDAASATNAAESEPLNLETLSDEALENLCVTACNVASATASKGRALPQDGKMLDAIMTRSRRVDCVKAAAKAWAVNLLQSAKGGQPGDVDRARSTFDRVMSLVLKQTQRVFRSISKLDEVAAQSALAALKALIKHCPEWSSDNKTLNAVVDRIFEFVRRPPGAGPKSASARLADLVRAKVLGMKVICYEVLRRIRSFDPDELIALRRLVLILRKFVADSGDPWGHESHRKNKGANATAATWPPEQDEASVQLRLYAGKALIKLEARCPGGPAREVLREAREAQQAHQREIQRWVELSWLALDPVEEAREAVVATLYKEFIMRGRELFRYGAFFPLAAALRPKGAAHGHLTQLLRFLQRTFQTKSARAAAAADGAGENLIDTAAQFAPENMISTLIYLVAHHPQMPRDREQAQLFVSSAAGQRVLVKPLVMLFDALSNVAPSHNTNAGLLYALLEVMRRHTDALDPGCDNIHMIGEIAQMLIKLRMKVSPDSLEYPGGVVLPKMYVAIQAQPLRQRSTNEATSPGLSSVTPRNSSKETERSAQRRRQYQQRQVLPANFELRVGSGGLGLVAAPDETLTPRRKRSRPQANLKTAAAHASKSTVASQATPTRRQPSRTTKDAVSGYADPEDLMLDE